MAMPRWVGEDGRRVGHQHGRTHPLEDTHGDQPVAGHVTGHPGDAQHQGEEGEHGETEVVGPHPSVDVAHSTQADHQHAGDDQKSEDHPQQIEGVAGLQRVEADAPKDIRKGDQHDGSVDRRHQHAQGRDEQGDPLVIAGKGHRRPVDPARPVVPPGLQTLHHCHTLTPAPRSAVGRTQLPRTSM
jgi:hypothetical protein